MSNFNPDQRTHIICDTSSLWARAFFAAQRTQTDAIQAALRSFMGVINHTNGTHAILCWDGKPKTTKVRKVPKPPEFDVLKRDFIRQVTWLFGVAHALSDEYEADDLVATYANHVADTDQIYIVSGDKDLTQLQGCRRDVPVYYYDLNEKVILTKTDITEKWSVKKPSQVALALAILGDKGDGVPGIKGWGPRKVEELFLNVTPEMNFQQALEVLEQHIPQNKLQEFYDCLEATILYTDAPMPEQVSAITWRDPGELRDAGLSELSDQYTSLYHRHVSDFQDVDVDFEPLES